MYTPGCQAPPVSIDEWWPKLDESTRGWMIEHNGQPVLPGVLTSVSLVGGTMDAEAWRVGQTHGPTGYYLSDDAIRWVADHAGATTR